MIFTGNAVKNQEMHTKFLRWIHTNCMFGLELEEQNHWCKSQSITSQLQR